MRPGFPILIEWGWSMYIGNDGKKETYFPQIPDFLLACMLNVFSFCPFPT